MNCPTENHLFPLKNIIVGPKDKFKELMKLASEKFELSNRHLGVSLCATPITPGKPVILGINWGGGSESDDHIYQNQTKMPAKEDFIIDDYPFLIRSEKLFADILKLDIGKGEYNYTNLCLFRSPDISSLIPKDFLDCALILREYVKYIKPPYILSMGNSNKKYLQPGNPEFELIDLGEKGQKGWRGNVWGNKFYCVPHPQSRFLNDKQRHEIWKSVFSG
jgi:hypothetical protein